MKALLGFGIYYVFIIIPFIILTFVTVIHRDEILFLFFTLVAHDWRLILRYYAIAVIFNP